MVTTSRFTRLLAFGFLANTLLSHATAQVGGERVEINNLAGDFAGDRFGTSVSGAGDVNNDGFEDYIVGAPYSDRGGTETGVATVFSGADGSLLFTKFGVNSAFGFNHTGQSVSGAGDVNGDGFDDFIIGSPQGSPFGVFRAGEALLYSGANGQLLRIFRGGAFDDWLGFSVASLGDIDGDGFDDVLIGAPLTDPIGVDRGGAAFAFSGATGSLLLTFIGLGVFDRLGTSVAGAGDVNGDGVPDIFVGAPGADPGGRTSAGSAFVYSGVDGSLIHRFDGADNGDSHGISVASAGDINADGFDDLVVGTTFFDGTGGATIYSGLTGTVLREYIGEAAGDGFGFAVSGGGDVDGDGVPDVLIGAHSADSNGVIDAGAAYLFSGATGNLLDRIGGTEMGGQHGISVSIMPASNGDGKADFLCGGARNSPGGLLESGTCLVLGFNPFLVPSSYSISASAGAAINLEMDFPDSAAGHEYRLVISGQGMGPTFFGIDIPISVDSLVMQTYSGSYPFPTSANLQGTLDLSGNANGSFDAPPGLPSGLIGSTFWFVVIANPAGLAPTFASIAIPITIAP